MTSAAVFDEDQDFSFPTVSDSSDAAANLFVMSSPSLWRVSSLVPADFFRIEDERLVPSCSVQERGDEVEAERPSTSRGGDDREDTREQSCHDRSETMDLLWEEFNFSEELLLQRVPSNFGAGNSMRGLDELHPKSRLSMDSCTPHRTSRNARKSETVERYDIPFHLQPLDTSRKISMSSDSGCSISISPKRQRRRAMMPKMVRKLLMLHKLARPKRS